MLAFLFKRPSVRSGGAKQTTRLQLQPLEDRDVPASLFTVDGHLRITGTEGNDHIRIQVEGGRLRVMMGDLFDPITVGSRLHDSIATSRVRRVTIYGLGGDDWIDATSSHVGVTIYGGAGDDRIFGSNFADRIDVGAGTSNVAFGMDGNDTIIGGSGRDTLYGGHGNDVLFGRAGNDVLWGEWGNDTLLGEAGDDSLYGGAGNDVLLGGNGADLLDGGAGDADAADAFYGIDVTRGIENSTQGGSRLVVNGALMTDIRQNDRPYCVFYSHLAGMAGILSARGRNLATERIQFKGRDASGNFIYEVSLFTSSGTPVTRTVRHNGPSRGDATPVDREAWVTIFEKAFMDQIRAEDPSGNLWRRYWDHQTVMTMLTGGCEQVHMLDHVSVLFGATLGDEHFANIAQAIREGKLVTASTWTTTSRGVSTGLLVRAHNYTVVGVDEGSRTLTLRNPWGFDNHAGRPASGDPSDGLITLSWADFKGSMQGYDVGVVA